MYRFTDGYKGCGNPQTIVMVETQWFGVGHFNHFTFWPLGGLGQSMFLGCSDLHGKNDAKGKRSMATFSQMIVRWWLNQPS